MPRPFDDSRIFIMISYPVFNKNKQKTIFYWDKKQFDNISCRSRHWSQKKNCSNREWNEEMLGWACASASALLQRSWSWFVWKCFVTVNGHDHNEDPLLSNEEQHLIIKLTNFCQMRANLKFGSHSSGNRTIYVGENDANVYLIAKLPLFCVAKNVSYARTP